MLNGVSIQGACRLPLSRGQPALLRAHRCGNGLLMKRSISGLPLRRLAGLPLPLPSASVIVRSTPEGLEDENPLPEEGRAMIFFKDMTTEQIEELHTRLCENDIDYNEMKHMCKDNELGGKDMKYNLRAKLIRRLREILGFELPDKLSYGHNFKRPDSMNDKELEIFYRQRHIFKPDNREEAVGMAFAILVTDEIITQDEVPTTSSYEKLTALMMKEACSERGLSTAGNKQDMLARLIMFDRQLELDELKRRAQKAAEFEKANASIYVPPGPPNRGMAQQLREAQSTMVAVKRMGLPELRAALLGRRLPVYGTLEVLVERLTNVLRRDVVDAHAGLRRMVKYAEAAVAKLSEDEVYEALAARGLVSHSASEDSTARLANSLVEEWIHASMLPPDKISEEENGEDEGFSGDGEGGSAVYNDADGSDGGESTEEPTLQVVMVCGGETVSQRDSALSAARAALPDLQSDMIWGTLMGYPTPALMDPTTTTADTAGIAGAAGGSDVPLERVNIMSTIHVANGVVVTLDSLLPPPGCTFMVTATPIDRTEYKGEGSSDNSSSTSATVAVSVESRTQDVFVVGLSPRTEYNFTARVRNAAGMGPESDPEYQFTYDREGVAAQVMYGVPATPLPASGSTDGVQWRYVRLTWEDLLGSSAEELDARYGAKVQDEYLSNDGAADNNPGLTLADAIAGPDIVLPLGLPPGEGAALDGAPCCATSWASSELRQLASSRPAFTSAARSMGFPAIDLLELHLKDTSEGALGAVSNQVSEWLAAQGQDVQAARVAVRAEVNGDVLGAGIGRGSGQVAAGAAALCERHGVNNVVLEVVHPAAVHFSVAVVQGEGGVAVALPPTEISYHDLEEDIRGSELQLARFQAVQEGQDPEKVDALLALFMEESKLHPGALGSMASPTQRIVHATPPTSLPAAVAERVRVAASKLFTDMQLQDFAQFSGWVVPEDPTAAAGIAPAIELLSTAAAAASANGADSSASSGTGTGGFKGKTFAELAQIDAQERAELSATTTARAISAAEAQGAVDVEVYTYAADEEEPEAALANGPVLREVGEGVFAEPVRYGAFKGIEIDDRTRTDLLAAAAAQRDPATPIREGAPVVTSPTELFDVAALDPASACHVDGHVIAFHGISLAPALGDALGPLAQQMAAAGLPLRALPRRLVSSAARRAGLPAVPPHRASLEDPELDDDDWPPVLAAEEEDASSMENSDKSALAPLLEAEGVEVSLEEIGAALEAWESPEPVPLPESYEDILAQEFDRAQGAEGSDGSASDEEADSAAAAAGLDRDVSRKDDLKLSSDILNSSDDESSDEYEATLLSKQFPGLHPTKQRVWILCGGEGPLRDASLKAAVHAMGCLQGAPDLLIETFFMDPPDAGAEDTERRRVLLQRRIDLLKIGATDEELLDELPEFHPTRIRYPAPTPPQDISRRGVWRLAGSPVVKTNAADLRDGCQTLLSASSIAHVNRHDGDAIHGTEQLLTTTRGELELAGVTPGGPAPWGGVLSAPRSPQYCFMEDWIAAAAQQCVVVLMALPGHPSAHGPLQQVLEANGVPFTGPSSISSDLCADRSELLRTLSASLRYDGSMINLPLVHTLSVPELGAMCDSATAADDFFSQVFGDWKDKMMVIRPAASNGGLGVARLSCGSDLRAYAAAVRSWHEVVPADSLAVEPEDVRMMLPPPTQFVIEPFLPATPLQLRPAGDHGNGSGSGSDSTSTAVAPTASDPLHRRLHWPTADSWLEVRACLLGDAGAMRCLELTTTVVEVARGPDGNEEFIGSFDLTPPPAAVLHPSMAADAHARMALIADRLSLSGAAQISALVSTINGEVVVLDVDPHPDLSPQGLLMRQAAAAAGNPLSPSEVLRELLKLGMSRGEELGTGMDPSAFISADDFVAEASEALDGKDPASPALDYYGDAYIKIDYGMGSGDEDEDEDNVVEEMEMEGLMMDDEDDMLLGGFGGASNSGFGGGFYTDTATAGTDTTTISSSSSTMRASEYKNNKEFEVVPGWENEEDESDGSDSAGELELKKSGRKKKVVSDEE